MKLLTKNEIDSAKARDRQLEVSEGLKLAKWVDALRQVSAEEEASLEKFRSTTIARIHGEIDRETTKLNSIKAEVSEYERRKEEALIPLDEEWSKVRRKSQEMNDKSVELSKWESELHDKDISLDKRERETLEQKQRADEAYKRSQSMLQDADALKAQANQVLQDASAIFRKAENESHAKMTNAEEKERFVEEREKAVAKEEERLRKLEIQLAKDRSALKDREDVLARNLKRK